MQKKLTLRLEEGMIRKAKLVARKRGKSVSRLVSDFFAEQAEDPRGEKLPSVTASMVGILGGKGCVEEAYGRYLEEKHQ